MTAVLAAPVACRPLLATDMEAPQPAAAEPSRWWELKIWCHRAWYGNPFWTLYTGWSQDFLEIAHEIHKQQTWCAHHCYCLRMVFEIEQHEYWPGIGFEPRSYV